VIIVPTSELNVSVCKSPPSFKTIGVQLVTDQTYKWYYRPKSTEPFMFNGKETPEISVSEVGEYYVQVSNEFCSVNSPLFTVIYENIDILIKDVPPICDQGLTSINLVASPLGGIWSGSNVSGTGLLLAKELASGEHNFTYQFLSASGCAYNKSITIIKDPLPPIGLEVVGELCGPEPVLLLAQPAPRGSYHWFRFNERLNFFELETSGDNLKGINVSTRSKYYLQIENLVCSTKSLEIEVNKRPQDSIFVANVITPNGDGKNDVLKVNGNIDIYSLKVINRYGSEVFYSNNNQP
jgi:hypothetical protein